MPLASEDIRRFEFGDSSVRSGTRADVVSCIKDSGFTVEYIHDPSNSGTAASRASADAFGLFLKPGATAKRRFGIDREVLLWCSTYPTFSARDIEKFRELQLAHGSRLSRMFVILVTKYSRDQRNGLESESQDTQTIVHLDLQDIGTAKLDALLARHLYARDPFNLAGAAVASADFFGRRDQVDSLVAEVETGTTQTGIFGLRKAGKTSLLNRVHEKLRNSGKVYTARLDLQLTMAVDSSPEYALWAIGEAVHASHKSVRQGQDFLLFGKYRTFSQAPADLNAWESFTHDLTLAINSSRRRICILIDEIERMYEALTGADFARLWRVIRGIDQQNAGKLRLILGGTSPECAELGAIEGHDNPLFNYLTVTYCGSLSEDDSRELLSTLGPMSGIELPESSQRHIYEQTGGHPALLRAVGSALHLGRPPGVDLAVLEVSDIQGADRRLAQKCAPLLEQMLVSLREQRPDELVLLESLALGQIYRYLEYANMFTFEASRLENYGLVDPANPPKLAIGRLASYMQQKHANPVPKINRAALPSGLEIGDWTIQEPLGSGGYADVYLATDSQDSEVAIKVFRGSADAKVLRESETLAFFGHAGIVRVIDTVALPDGRLGIVMERLHGDPLAAYCYANRRPDYQAWVRWLSASLDALAHLHPESTAPPATEMTVTQQIAWSRAKFGYVHRDIKPENIIIHPDRGPVFIDFNIASRAGDPVSTTSMTPGYFSPHESRWSATTDLYALGVAFAEVAASARVHDAELPDLLTGAQRNYGGATQSILKLVLDARGNRMSAGELAREVRRIGSGGRVAT